MKEQGHDESKRISFWYQLSWRLEYLDALKVLELRGRGYPDVEANRAHLKDALDRLENKIDNNSLTQVKHKHYKNVVGRRFLEVETLHTQIGDRLNELESECASLKNERSHLEQELARLRSDLGDEQIAHLHNLRRLTSGCGTPKLRAKLTPEEEREEDVTLVRDVEQLLGKGGRWQ